MSPSRFFEMLGAPLANVRWSWGARRASDGVIFLRVWQDTRWIENGRLHFLVARPPRDDDYARNPGYKERLRHVEQIRSGVPCFLVMCIAVDAQARPRKIESFNEDEVFVGGTLVQRGADTYIEVTGRKPVSALLPARP